VSARATTTLTWLGHSSVVVEMDGARLVTDPVLRRRVAHLTRQEAVPVSAVGALDAVLISHVHRDHLDIPSLALIGHSVPVIVPLNDGAVLRRRGFDQVIEVCAGDELTVGPLRVEVVPAEHGVVRRSVRARSRAVSFVIHGSRRVYFAGDTDLFAEMADVAPVDVALLPIAGWGPRVPAGHLDARRAAEALRLVRPATAVPVHWGTYHALLSAPPDDRAARAFVEQAAELAPDVAVRVLRPGETLAL
jgi:L-ascorbate metabolism protein UlaG (beta-lactamase superfamily)